MHALPSRRDKRSTLNAAETKAEYWVTSAQSTLADRVSQPQNTSNFGQVKPHEFVLQYDYCCRRG